MPCLIFILKCFKLTEIACRLSMHDFTKYVRLYLYAYACIFEPRHEISNKVVCATSKASDHPTLTRSLIRASACHLSII